MPAQLIVVAYHYVRDLPRTRFPRIKGMLTDNFRRQVLLLGERYEMATLESALAFLAGKYQPARDLCLLTFDDGLKDHYSDVLPVLAERHIQGLFFVPTACLGGLVASVHKSHFLMAALDFEEYRQAFLRRLAEFSPGTRTEVNMIEAQLAYRWDAPEVAAFKYLLNFGLPEALRDQILDDLFAEYLGDESEFARQLYLSWDEAREMQTAGMLIGGHSHNHVALSLMDDDCQRADLETCAELLHSRLNLQPLWPFTYPFGQSKTFNSLTVQSLRDLGFACSFTTELGINGANQDPFSIRRIDTNDVVV